MLQKNEEGPFVFHCKKWNKLAEVGVGDGVLVGGTRIDSC